MPTEWHRHGSAWVLGIVPRDGCALCDAAYAAELALVSTRPLRTSRPSNANQQAPPAPVADRDEIEFDDVQLSIL